MTSASNLTIRRDDEIHQEDGPWFTARWHFSFGGYRDPAQMGVGPLRVFNDDRIIAGAEWPMHPHRDIESLTYVVEGEFAHGDSLGNGGNLVPGAAQVMTFSSAGSLHSEKNGSQDAPLRFMQFWILPSEEGLTDAVQQQQFSTEDRTDRWLQIMGPVGTDGLDLHSDSRALVTRLTAGTSLDHHFATGRGGYVYVIDGAVTLDEEELAAGDSAKVTGASGHDLSVTAVDTAEVILIDVPMDFQAVGIWAGLSG